MKSISVDRQTTKLICQFDELYSFFVLFCFYHVYEPHVAYVCVFINVVAMKPKQRKLFDCVNRKRARGIL